MRAFLWLLLALVGCAPLPRRPIAPEPRPVFQTVVLRDLGEAPVDCDAIRVSVRGSVYGEDGRLLRQMGPVAAGKWSGDDFGALHFFLTVREARECEPQLEQAVWDERDAKWVRP